jgi:hypothetical protein
MELVKSIKKAFAKKICSICLAEVKLTRFDRLEICQDCFEKVKKLEAEEPVKISKEQTAGGIKDEL